MLVDIARLRWARMLSEPNEHSRMHVRLFVRQAAFVVLFSVPASFLDQHKPALFFLVMREMFGFSALGALGGAVLLRRPVSTTSLCIWDHAAAMLLITLVLSVVLRLTLRNPLV
jgi:hypothetical protein